MNNAYDFPFCNLILTALPQGALWIADHRATLEKLAALIDTYDPQTVICLGDSFDDIDAVQSLDEQDHLQLATLKAGRDWIWIEGNHDPGPVDLGGQHLASFCLGPLTFRHIATPETGEISGHYHPKCSLRTGGTRAAFLTDASRIIMPAFGTYTGGLRSSHPTLRALMAEDATAILTGRKALPVPLKSTT